ncbi:hypothetical protein J2S43_001807 [Catenuloplanes nepalensis]|uniref:F5/8 type C domain-containing protein n=1 Tax=Catenuloplanes nepalensis TaxID=587533 RepID=A0ABT9MPD6_9ACTN|nr:discoidin domain-containing protein [Catenuloplanes nepalensis]MDP9793295.1 hypothetical protein [Catenuloplanes nepalensis]
MHTVTRGALVALLGVAVTAAAPVLPAHAATAPPTSVPPVSQIDQELYNRMLNVLDPALEVAVDTQMRVLVRNAVARQFDGDTNTLWSTVIQEAEEAGVADPNAPSWQQLKNAVANFQGVLGYDYEPQIYIPNWGEGVYAGSAVTVTVAPASETAASAPGYRIDQYGNVSQITVDEAYADVNEVWVLSVNERIREGGGIETALPDAVDTKAGPEAPAAGAGMGTSAVCNPTGLRNPKGAEYFRRWKVTNDNFGELFEGKREMRMVIITSNGFVLRNHYFSKVKKKHVKNWQDTETFITTWDQSVYGSVMAYQWYEVDGGKTVNTTVSVPLQGGGSVSTTISKQEKDDEAGSAVVYFGESTYTTYDTSRVAFEVCSQGGDGGTGGDQNFACGALASASSTYPHEGYAPSRVTDCNKDTRLGGPYSWSNAATLYPPTNPQWVQADFGVERTVRRVVVYTSAGYPIRDYDVQVWNGLNYLTVAEVRGNTALQVTSTFSLRNTRLIRILGRSGPAHQQLHVRVNELEAYAN